MDAARVDHILRTLALRKVAVLGDFCVDRYLLIDPSIHDVSNETDLPVHAVTEVRAEPGGGSNVVKDLRVFGVGEVYPVGYLGLNGEGFELGRAFDSFEVRRDFLQFLDGRPTPVYTKPVLCHAGRPHEEMSRFDIAPRGPLDPDEETRLLDHLAAAFALADAVIVADYSEAGKPGVVSPRVRDAVSELARAFPETPVVADSRLFINEFRDVIIKPNVAEASEFLAGRPGEVAGVTELMEIGRETSERNRQPLMITLGPEGALLCDGPNAFKVPVFPSQDLGEIDPVGAGDQVASATAACLSAGASLGESGILAMVAASLSIQEVGTCGAARPEQVAERFAEYAQMFPDAVGA
jgi:rfaE bifunctional protein kinase chain/domain